MSVFFYLIIRRELHGGDAVDMLLHFVEEIVPAADDLALVLVVYEVQLVALPRLANLREYDTYFNNLTNKGNP